MKATIAQIKKVKEKLADVGIKLISDSEYNVFRIYPIGDKDSSYETNGRSEEDLKDALGSGLDLAKKLKKGTPSFSNIDKKANPVVRVYELSHHLKMSHDKLIELAHNLGINVKGAMSPLSDFQVDLIEAHLTKSNKRQNPKSKSKKKVKKVAKKAAKKVKKTKRIVERKTSYGRIAGENAAGGLGMGFGFSAGDTFGDWMFD